MSAENTTSVETASDSPVAHQRLVSCERVHSSISYTKVEVRGTWGISGPQEVGTPGGAPAWVGEVLRDNPKIQAVCYVTENGGAIYQRLAANDGADR